MYILLLWFLVWGSFEETDGDSWGPNSSCRLTSTTWTHLWNCKYATLTLACPILQPVPSCSFLAAASQCLASDPSLPWSWSATPLLALTTANDLTPLLSLDRTVVFKKVTSQWSVWNSKNFPTENYHYKEWWFPGPSTKAHYGATADVLSHCLS